MRHQIGQNNRVLGGTRCMAKRPDRAPRKPPVSRKKSLGPKPAPSAIAPPVPLRPLPPGEVGAEIPLDPTAFQKLITAAASESTSGGQQVWTKDSSELTVIAAKVTVALDDGLILVTIPVSCDQVASASIEVPFATGGADTPAGMVFATEERPRGPAAIVDLWSEALTAFAWRLLVTVMQRLTLQAGVDEDGAGLLPIAVTATKVGIRLLPIARHTFDRVLS